MLPGLPVLLVLLVLGGASGTAHAQPLVPGPAYDLSAARADLFGAESPGADGDRGITWVNAVRLQRMGLVLTLMGTVASITVLRIHNRRRNGYPIRVDSYGCGGRRLPTAAGILAASGIGLVIGGTIGRGRRRGPPTLGETDRRTRRRIDTGVMLGLALGSAALIAGTALGDVFCNT